MDERRKRDTRGRKIATGERRAELLAAFDTSGLTQRAFARREGVNFHTFVAWLQRRRGFAGILSLLKKVAVRLAARVRPKALLGEACGYLLAQWAPLTAHLDHGQTRLDTNLVENAIRPTKLGAKNWLFIGHPDAGERSAIIYSLVGSCRRHGIDPLAYLRDVLTRLPTMTNQDDLAPLLPSKWSSPLAAGKASNP